MKLGKTALVLMLLSAFCGCKSASMPANRKTSSPFFVSQPSNETVIVGQAATFAVKAEGMAPLQFQWYRDGQMVAGANSPIYTIPTTTLADDGATFQVTVKSPAGSVNSKEAILGVNAKANSYSIEFTSIEDPISDGGKWVDGQSAGGNLWGDVQTDGKMAFGVSEPTEFGDPTAVVTGRWAASQKIAATVRVNNVPTGRCCHEVEVRLRTVISTKSITGYEAYCSVMPTRPYCHIARWNGPNGGYCNIETTTPNIYVANGDVLSATISGVNPVVITGYKNGTKIMQALDTGQACDTGGAAGPFASGNPGIGFFDNTDSHWNYFGLSNFTAADGLDF